MFLFLFVFFCVKHVTQNIKQQTSKEDKTVESKIHTDTLLIVLFNNNGKTEIKEDTHPFHLIVFFYYFVHSFPFPVLFVQIHCSIVAYKEL